MRGGSTQVYEVAEVKRDWELREVREDGSAKTYIYETREQREHRTLLDDLLAAAPLYLLVVVILCGFTLGMYWALGFPE